MSKTATVLTAGLDLPTAGTWEVDPAHSTVGFIARHLMVTKVRGRFSDFKANVIVDAVPENSSVTATIDMISIDTASEQRDAHLRSADFFDADAFPHMTFISHALRPIAGPEFTLLGDLTIKDVTRPVELNVEYLGMFADPWGGTRAGFSASVEINREDWGLTWNQALEAGGFVVGKKVTIELEIQAKYIG